MALRAGYYGLKRSLKDKLFNLAASTPADISPDNPIAGKNDVLASIDLLDDTVGWIGKNLLRFPYSEGNVTDRNGITWTVNSDGTITANGTSTADEVFALYDGNTLPRDIPLTVVGGLSNNFYLYVNGRKNGQYVKTYLEQRGEPKEFTILSTDDVDEIYVRLRINVNQTVNNLVFYPMICRSDVYTLTSTYEPYHESVEEMLTPKLLPSGSNLNYYITEGDYFAGADTYDNCPFSNTTFRLKVLPFNNPATRCIQIIYANKPDPEVYMRTNFGGTWNSWYKFTGTEVTLPSPTPENETKKATKKKVIKEEE